MAPVPFKVGRKRPRFLIVAFLGYDHDLPHELVDQHLNEMARGAGPEVAILAVTDHPLRPGQVVEVTSRKITLLKGLGEINTGDGKVLGGLLARALATYRGQPRVAIGFSGHGSGVFNEEPVDQLLRAVALYANPRAHLLRWLKADPILQSAFAVLHDQPSGQLTNNEIGHMLQTSLKAAKRGPSVELLFFDTCLNGMIEIVTEFAEFADCVVASEENEPVTGWHYDKWLSRMTKTPPADALAWGGQAVEAMNEAYGGHDRSEPVTLSAVSTRLTSTAAVERFKALVDAAELLGQEGYCALNTARRASLALGYRKVDSYDLVQFAEHLGRRADMPTLANAATALAQAVHDAVIHLTRPRAPTCHGLAFWFPGTRQSYDKDVGTYSRLRFDRATGWSDYLARHL